MSAVAAAVPVQYSSALRSVMTDDDCGAGAEGASPGDGHSLAFSVALFSTDHH